jgi:hypothetical protein
MAQRMAKMDPISETVLATLPIEMPPFNQPGSNI